MNPAAAPRPGDVNAHTHIYSALAPFGMPAPSPPPESFLQILERVWWRLDRALDEPSLAASSRLYVAESLLHGTTTLVDHHESPGFIEGSLEVIAEACEALGMRALLCFGATERNGGRDEARRGLEECRRFVRTNRRGRVRGVVGLHASFTVSDETAREAGALAAELGTVVHAHVAEDGADVEDAKRRGYAGPLERLLELGALPPGSIMAHGVHLDERQVKMAEEHRVWIVQNPRSNEGNRVGYARALSASRRVALGTDGYPADMRAEREALLRLARANGELARVGAEAVAARAGAGHSLAAERFGAGGDGTRDEVERDPGTGMVRRVTVSGETVVREGCLARGDLEEIRARGREAAAQLWKRMEAL